MTNAGEDVEQQEPLSLLMEMQNGIQLLWKTMDSFLPYDPAISLTGIFQNVLKTYIHANISRKYL